MGAELTISSSLCEIRERTLAVKNIKLVFWGTLAVVSLLWVAADPAVFDVRGVFALRSFMMQYSGVLAMAAMSVAMVLALRPRWPERWTMRTAKGSFTET